MTNAQYEDLWNTHLAPHVNGIPMPPINGHLVRENQLEDYLDIFRGVNTRPNRVGVIAMPYPHPFFNTDGSPKLKTKPLIKYLLIGEAAPPPIKPIIPVAGCVLADGDKGNTYFYDITHVRNTSWLSAPLTAFKCPDYRPCPENKIKSLLCLAEKGVLLLDTFPFSIGFTTRLRVLLNPAGVTMNFWNNPMNVYNLQDRVIGINPLLSDDWDLCLVAPFRISDFIIDPINHFSPLLATTPGVHPVTFRDILPSPLRAAGSDWKKLTISRAYVNVSHHLISLAFDL